MRLERVRAVLAAVDDADADLNDVLRIATNELSPTPEREPSDESRDLVAQLIRRRKWQVGAESHHSLALAAALDALAAAGQPLDADALAAYADGAARVAGREIEWTAGEGRDDAATFAVTGTVLAEPVLLAARRMAHEHYSSQRFAREARGVRR